MGKEGRIVLGSSLDGEWIWSNYTVKSSQRTSSYYEGGNKDLLGEFLKASFI